MNEVIKACAGYAGATAMSWIASRYHLSGDQVSAMMADAGIILAAGYGIYAHTTAAKGNGNGH